MHPLPSSSFEVHLDSEVNAGGYPAAALWALSVSRWPPVNALARFLEDEARRLERTASMRLLPSATIPPHKASGY